MPDEVLGLVVRTTEVVHPSGAPSTAVWLSDGRSMLAYSGDTQWTGALITAADGADLSSSNATTTTAISRDT